MTESLRLPFLLLTSRFRGNLFAFVSAFDFTCSQLPVPPLGRTLTCAECGVFSAAEATSDATSNAMLVPCCHLGAALHGLCSLPSHICLFYVFLSFLSFLPSPLDFQGSHALCLPSACKLVSPNSRPGCYAAYKMLGSQGVGQLRYRVGLSPRRGGVGLHCFLLLRESPSNAGPEPGLSPHLHKTS